MWFFLLTSMISTRHSLLRNINQPNFFATGKKQEVSIFSTSCCLASWALVSSQAQITTSQNCTTERTTFRKYILCTYLLHSLANFQISAAGAGVFLNREFVPTYRREVNDRSKNLLIVWSVVNRPVIPLFWWLPNWIQPVAKMISTRLLFNQLAPSQFNRCYLSLKMIFVSISHQITLLLYVTIRFAKQLTIL